MTVRLWRLDGPLLAELTRVAVAGAEPTEVMPPLPEDGTAGAGEPKEWTPRREAAFGAFHRDQSMGPAAPQITFAIIVADGESGADGTATDAGVADAGVAGAEGGVSPGTGTAQPARGTSGRRSGVGANGSRDGVAPNGALPDGAFPEDALPFGGPPGNGRPDPAAPDGAREGTMAAGEAGGSEGPSADGAVPPPAPVDAAEAGEQVVGAARLAPVEGEPGTVEAGLWIARSYRGRGLGRQVLRELRAAARSRGARCLLARTRTDNAPARRLLTEEYGVAEPDQADGAVTARVELNPVAGLLLGHPVMPGPLPAFDPDRAPEVPGPLFADWLAEAVAAHARDPQVVTLSTVDSDGFPDARVLTLRDVDPEGGCWVFASNAHSAKGRQLAVCPAAALTLYWPRHGRQVRVRGSVGTSGRDLAADDFRTRSRASRVSGLVGRQSEVLGSLAEYDAAVAEAERRLGAEPDLVPPGHTLYALYAREVEFWQGAADRRHVRLRYSRTAPGRWTRELRWP